MDQDRQDGFGHSVDQARTGARGGALLGRIDGQAKRVDETWYVQKFTPRAARSLWSKINCARATALVAAGRVKPAGLAEIARAKQDGRWARADHSPSRATVPDDLAEALGRSARASAFFDSLDSRNRYAILHRVQTAKKPETRARRIAQFVKMLAQRQKIFIRETCYGTFAGAVSFQLSVVSSSLPSSDEP